MMRRFAWCGTNTSTSATVSPAAVSARVAESTETVVANLYTCAPSMRTYGVAAGSVLCPAAATSSSSAPEPSEPSSKPRMPVVEPFRASTTAPAPSPKRTHVERSPQSSRREKTSVPTTSTVSARPALSWP